MIPQKTESERGERRKKKKNNKQLSLEWKQNCLKPLRVGNPCIALAAVPLCGGITRLVSAPLCKAERNRLSSAFYASAVQKETTTTTKKTVACKRQLLLYLFSTPPAGQGWGAAPQGAARGGGEWKGTL